MRGRGLLLLATLLPLAGQGWAQAPSLPQGPLSLLEAIELGRRRGVAAVVARINQQAAGTRTAQRRGDLLPTISGSAHFTRQTLNLDEFGLPFASGTTPDFSLFDLRIRASQNIFDASIISRLRAAADSSVAAGLDAQAVGELTGATAGVAYLRVLSAEETVRARIADSAVAATLLDQAKQLVSSGVSPAIDETRSRVGFAGVLTQLSVARNQQDRSRLDLARALDLPASQPLQLTDSLALLGTDLPLEPDSAVAFAMAHRSEVAAEHARTQAIDRTLRAIRFENLPSLSLAGEYKESGRETGSLRGTYDVTLQLSIPVLDGFKRQNRYREQQFRLEGQRVREADLARQVETETRQAILDLASAQQQVTLASDQLRLAELELRQAEERFQAGVAGSVETTNAQGRLIQARDALIQARAGYGTARVSLYRALGVLDQLH